MRKPGEHAPVELAPMSAEQFEKWMPRSIAEYAREHTVGGKWTAEEALSQARREVEDLLPKGMATPGHRFFSILRLPDRKAAGILWIEVQNKPTPAAFIFDIEIFKPFRRRGYARRAMALLEDEARRLGLQSIRLHVFGHNSAARSLYKELGYVETNIQMTKRLLRRRPARRSPPS